MANNRNRKFNKKAFSFGWFFLSFFFVWLFGELIYKPYFSTEIEVPYSVFIDHLARKDVEAVQMPLGGNTIAYSLKDSAWKYYLMEEDRKNKENPVPTVRKGISKRFEPLRSKSKRTFITVRMNDPDLMNRLSLSGAEFGGAVPVEGPIHFVFFRIILPFLPLIIIWIFILRSMNGSSLSFNKSKAKEIVGEMTGVTFKDVGGLGEAETELKEIIEFLSNPKQFKKFGAKMPKGILLVGPPGTGKTMLARAVAGEAKVPFFFITGSDFIELFVGLGAARVRDLFEQAKNKAPCIIFIDEIDAVGGKRQYGGSGGHDEHQQTLNQLLSEMDGFSDNKGVVIMAATNLPEALDSALLRPGRFDRQIQIVLPTEPGRIEILKIHTKKMKLDADVVLEHIAKVTPGFSGADLSNMANEAALMAIRRRSNVVSRCDFDLAIERIVAGLQKKTPLTPEVRRRVAYHETGHALVARSLQSTDPVHKISIIPTTKGALGYTMQMPSEDRYIVSDKELEEKIAVLMGGRAAEKIIFNSMSTGAANDLERATETAFRMVAEYGMSDALGPARRISKSGGYLGENLSLKPDLSNAERERMETEVNKILTECMDKATSILTEQIDALHKIAQVLQDCETITGQEMEDIIQKLAEKA